MKTLITLFIVIILAGCNESPRQSIPKQMDEICIKNVVYYTFRTHMDYHVAAPAFKTDGSLYTCE